MKWKKFSEEIPEPESQILVYRHDKMDIAIIFRNHYGYYYACKYECNNSACFSLHEPGECEFIINPDDIWTYIPLPSI